MDKNEFIALLRKGDDEAFTQLVNIYSRRLFAYAVSLSGDHSMAKDIVQEVFLKTFENRKKLNSNYSIEGFLYRVTYNLFVNIYHRDKLQLKVHDEYLRYLNQIIESDDDHKISESLNNVKKSIRKLPKNCKKIFLLSKKQGYTNKEISEILNISIKTVESQITIAFKKIRKDLKLT